MTYSSAGSETNRGKIGSKSKISDCIDTVTILYLHLHLLHRQKTCTATLIKININLV